MIGLSQSGIVAALEGFKEVFFVHRSAQALRTSRSRTRFGRQRGQRLNRISEQLLCDRAELVERYAVSTQQSDLHSMVRVL